mgnify:CR=1 FL=1
MRNSRGFTLIELLVVIAIIAILAAILFCIGVYGVIARKNAVLVLMSIELILNSVNINRAIRWESSFFLSLVNEQVTDSGRPAGTIGWCGLANLYYWIDIKNIHRLRRTPHHTPTS